MQLNILQEIINLKNSKKEFSVITDTKTSKTYIFFANKPINIDLKSFEIEINKLYNSRKDGMIKDSDLFIKHYHRPIKVVIVGAVHISQFFVEFAKSLNLDIYIIDFNGRIIKKKVGNREINIPHERMHIRNFVLLPLFEINKDWFHPKLRKNIVFLLSNLSSEQLLGVKIVQ